jgi:hypothetical protein
MKKNTLLEEIKRIQELTYDGKTVILENDVWDLFTGKKHDEKKADVVEPEVDTFYQSLNAAAQSGLSQRQSGQMGYQKEVESMQIGLQLLGYELPRFGVDGKFGPETAVAVQKFKKENLQLNESSSELRDTLGDLGYKEKGSEISSGGEISDDLSEIVSKILVDFKKTNPGVKVTVTSGNDRFHKGLDYTSKHTLGQAIDLTLSPYNQNNAGVFKKILDGYLKSGGSFSYIDEYENPSKAATGGHFHLQVGGAVAPGANNGSSSAGMEQATPEMITKMISMLQAKGIKSSDINQYTNVVAGVENMNYTGGTDNDFYKAILTGIGAPVTPENLKFLYAWRQSEGKAANFNPFNTTWKMEGSTPMNSDGVQVYKSAQDGLNATIKTLSKSNYNCITNGLRQNIGADNIAACSQALRTWGTGDLVAKVVASYNQGASPKISTIMA